MLRTEGQKGYFYDIPFDPAATYKTFRDGVEFYSSEMGNSFIGGPPVIYKYHEKQPVRLDGFHPGKSCKIKEAMDVLPDKDYVFDIDRFTSFEGNTGPYILYTIVRIKSILNKYQGQGGALDAGRIPAAENESQKALELMLARFNGVLENAFEELAPHKVCAYIYELANCFNKFYHETKILGEENEEKRANLISLLVLTKKVLELCIDVLGFEAPSRM